MSDKTTTIDKKQTKKISVTLSEDDVKALDTVVEELKEEMGISFTHDQLLQFHFKTVFNGLTATKIKKSFKDKVKSL